MSTVAPLQTTQAHGRHRGQDLGDEQFMALVEAAGIDTSNPKTLFAMKELMERAHGMGEGAHSLMGQLAHGIRMLETSGQLANIPGASQWINDSRNALENAMRMRGAPTNPPAIHYGQISKDCLAITRHAPGTVAAKAFVRGAEWYRNQVIAADQGNSIPAGTALVPIRMNTAMQIVVSQASWKWADLLVAAQTTPVKAA